jgi:hypothetical protein
MDYFNIKDVTFEGRIEAFVKLIYVLGKPTQTEGNSYQSFGYFYPTEGNSTQSLGNSIETECKFCLSDAYLSRHIVNFTLRLVANCQRKVKITQRRVFLLKWRVILLKRIVNFTKRISNFTKVLGSVTLILDTETLNMGKMV